MSYTELDSGYAEDENLQELRQEVHEVARETVRPIGREIDAMSDGEYARVADDGSPYWDVLDALKEKGYHRDLIPEEFGGGGFGGREFHVIMEELAWGSPGLAMAFGVDIMPALLALMTFDDDVEESYVRPYLENDERHQGCWGVTEPDHGSELVMSSLLSEGPDDGDAEIGPPQATARKDGDEWVIDGMKSRWVSAAPMATHCALHVDMKPGEGSPGGLCIVPLDSDGVTKGEPIEKLGQRDCPQGELRFDGVRIPDRMMVMTPEMLHPDTGYVSFDQILCITSAGMSAASTGLARAAFEEALAYAREREQGGKPIAEHQSVKRELYDMFEKVETCRAYSRRVTEHVWERTLGKFEFDASHRHALAAQVYCKRSAFEVAHKAVQIHGGNGITSDYLVEKLFRDARVKLIEDGTTEVLGMESAEGVVESYDGEGTGVL